MNFPPVDLFLDPGEHWGLAGYISGQLWFAWGGKGFDALRAHLGRLNGWRIASLTVERPIIRPRGRGPTINANSLLSCYAYGPFARGVIPYPVTYREIIPEDWKGQVPKPIHHARARQYLNPAEVCTFDGAPSLDAKDAACLGLFMLERIDRGATSGNSNIAPSAGNGTPNRGRGRKGGRR